MTDRGEKIAEIILPNGQEVVTLHQKNIRGLYRFDRDSHHIKNNTEQASLVNGGPYKLQ